MRRGFRNNKGNIIIALLLVMFLTFLGLSLLGFSIFHSWIRNARTQRLTETDRMRQELIYYLHSFREKVLSQDLRPFTNPAVDYFNKSYFPDTTVGAGSGGGKILIKNSFTNLVFPKGFYTKTRIIDRMNVSSSKNNYTINAEVFIDMASGQIPLTFFPFLVGNPGEIPVNMENVENMDGGSSYLALNGAEVEFNASDFLANCLEVQGTALTWAAMREKFGFEVSNDPIPEGIHLLVEDNQVKCIFIQGDVERLVFSTTDNIQKILVSKGGVAHEYHYKPGENYFIDCDNLTQEPWLFKEKIVVNGNIWALEQVGDAAFAEAAHITLFASGTVIIRSDLVTKTKNLDLQKIMSTSLTLVSASGTLFDREDLKPGIKIAPKDGENDTCIEASIITNGKLTNESQELEIRGSIYCKELENQGHIKVHHVDTGSDWGTFFRTMDFKYIYHFHINFIEEIEETP
ncbi:MAG: hypothetical protein QG657_4610 [Acidobacteriota bacterium]|nr:hypothetical protein [Acidobacteriota bacterium]